MKERKEKESTIYFSHDANAHRDEKLIAIRMKHGWAGIGLFWTILEKMREASNYMCVKDYNLLAFDLRVDASIIKSLVEDFGLFVFTQCGKYFYSERLHRTIAKMEKKSQEARDKVNKRWGKGRELEVENDTAFIPQYNNGNTDEIPQYNDGNTSKVKETINNNFTTSTKPLLIPEVVDNNPIQPQPTYDLSQSNLFRKPRIPTIEKVKEVFNRHGGTNQMAQKFFDVNETSGWYYKGNPIQNFENLVNGFIATWKDIEEKNKKNHGKQPPFNRTSTPKASTNAANIGTNISYD